MRRSRRFVDGVVQADSRRPVGFDIEKGEAIAKRMGVSAEFDNMGFDEEMRCPPIGHERHQDAQEDSQFLQLNGPRPCVDCAGNPKGIAGYDAVCGLTVGAQVATTNLEEVTGQSRKCVADGRKPIDLKAFQNHTGLRLAQASNHIDAHNQTAATATYAITQDPATFQMGRAGPIAANEGIATRKDDKPLKTALDSAITSLYIDGAMQALATK